MKLRKVLATVGIDSSSGREVLSGIFSYIESGHPWKLRLVQSERELTEATVRTAEAGGVDGILLTFLGDKTALRALQQTSIPIVFLGARKPGFERRHGPTALVWNDNIALGRAAAEHLLSQGVFKSYVYVHSRKNGNYSTDRAIGFAAALKGARLALSGEYDAAHEEGSADDIRELADWLKTFPRPLAVMAACDRRALHVLASADAAKLSVPKQLSLIGVDNDMLLSVHSTPPLTSVQPGHFEMGFKAAAELQRLMSARKSPKLRTTLVGPTRVVSRESTGFVAPTVSLVDRAKRFIRAHATEGVSVSDVVSHLGCSRTLADLRYRQLEGKTIRAALEEARLDEVRKLLRTTNRSVVKIAEQCGFSSNHALTHVFTRQFGSSPQVWRLTTAAEDASAHGRGKDGRGSRVH